MCLLNSGELKLLEKDPLLKSNLISMLSIVISCSTSANIVLTQEKKQSVRVEGQANIIAELSTKVVNGSWKIHFDKNIRTSKKLTIYISIPTLKRISSNGSGKISGTNAFKSLGDFTCQVNGSGNITLGIYAKYIKAGISGSGTMRLKGNAEKAKLTISGSGSILAYGFHTQETNARISGSGSTRVSVVKSLDGSISGSGNINYLGSPDVNAHRSGSGRIRKGSNSKK